MSDWLRKLYNWLQINPETPAAQSSNENKELNDDTRALIVLIRERKKHDSKVRCVLALDRVAGRAGSWLDASFHLDPRVELLEEDDLSRDNHPYGVLDEMTEGMLRELLKEYLDLFDLILIGNNAGSGHQRARITADMIDDENIRQTKILVVYNVCRIQKDASEYEALGITKFATRETLDVTVMSALGL